jgi:hypothetical protein
VSSLVVGRPTDAKSVDEISIAGERTVEIVRGHIRERRTWESIVDVGPHPVTGKRRQKCKSGFTTKTEAESTLREFVRHVEGGGDPSPALIRLVEYLTRWIGYQRAQACVL